MGFTDEDGNSDDEDDVYLLHNLAEQGRVDCLRALLPLPSTHSAPPPRLRVLSSETSLLEKDDMGFLPLHVAIIHQQVDCALHLLRYSPALTSAMLRLKGGDFNTPILHLILRVGAINALCSEQLINELFDSCGREEVSDNYGDDVRALLFEKITEKDEEGNTVFHLCARYDLVACMNVLTLFYKQQFTKFDEETKTKTVRLETLLEQGNRVKFRPLHEAMKYQAIGVARTLVSEYNVDIDLVTSLHQTPAHIAALANFAEGVEILRLSPRTVAATLARKDIYGLTAAQVAHKCAFDALEKRLLAVEEGQDVAASACRERLGIQKDDTRFFFHPEVWRHLPMAYHRRGGSEPPPENPERIDTLVDPVFGILRSREFQRPNVKWEQEIERADLADILRVHEYHYVDRVRRKCASLAASVVHKKPIEVNSIGTSDHVLSNKAYLTNEECHATFSLDSDTTLSVRSYDAAIRAAGAVCKAVDDVIAGKCRNAFCIVRPPGHHAGPVGKVVCENDPEGSLGFCLFNNVAVGAAYARAHFKHRGIDKVAILDFDVHHGNGTEEIVRQLVPSTEEIVYETPYGSGKQIVHQYKPWRSDDDSDNVFFCSVHGYGHKDPENQDELGKGETRGWFFPGSGTSNVKEGPSIWNEGLVFCPEGGSPASRLKWRSAFRDRILPSLRAFDPDIIFLSAGFDAHKKELVNWGYVSLLEQDYEWLVDHVKQVANTCCDGRLISVLEGGYNFHGRMVSPFARSVAAHTRALINPSQELWDEVKIAKEASHELALLAKYLAPAGPAGMSILPNKKRDQNETMMTRVKRVRKHVDYVALAQELAQQQQ